MYKLTCKASLNSCCDTCACGTMPTDCVGVGAAWTDAIVTASIQASVVMLSYSCSLWPMSGLALRKGYQYGGSKTEYVKRYVGSRFERGVSRVCKVSKALVGQV